MHYTIILYYYNYFILLINVACLQVLSLWYGPLGHPGAVAAVCPHKNVL